MVLLDDNSRLRRHRQELPEIIEEVRYTPGQEVTEDNGHQNGLVQGRIETEDLLAEYADSYDFDPSELNREVQACANIYDGDPG